MIVKLNGESINNSADDSTFKEVVAQAKETCREDNQVVVGIEVEGEFLSQQEWEQIADEPVGNQEINLITESGSDLSVTLAEQAYEFLSNLSQWLDQFDTIEDFDDSEIEELLQSFAWLNFAIEEIPLGKQQEILIAGQPLEKIQQETQLFLSELKGAVNNRDENQELLTSLLIHELPNYLDQYKHVFQQLKQRVEGRQF